MPAGAVLDFFVAQDGFGNIKLRNISTADTS
jgi:hypothetical protein